MDSSVNSTMTHAQPDTQHPMVTSYDDAFDRPLVIVGDSKWTAPATGMLLDLYIQNEDKFNSPHIKKKLLWRKISERLNEAGHMFDADKCERKFLNLKTTYRYTVDHNIQTGNQKRCAFYDHLDSIFKFQASAEAASGYSTPGNTREETMEATASHHNRSIPPPDRGNTAHAPHPAFPVSKNEVSPMHSNAQYMNRLSNAVAGTKSNQHVSMATRHDPTRVSHDLSNNKNQNNPVMNFPSPTNNFTRQNIQNFPRFPQSAPAHRISNDRPNLSPQLQNHVNTDSNSSATRHPPTYIINDDEPQELPSSSGRVDESETSRFQRSRKRKQTELDYLLSTFEHYCDEQRDREEKRLKCMKEWHDEEMKVMNRFLDIIQQSIQSNKN